MASPATLDYCCNLLKRQEVAGCVENVTVDSPGYVPGESTLEVFPTCAVPPVILNRGFKRVACRGLQALPRGSAHQPVNGAATALIALVQRVYGRLEHRRDR